MLKMMVKTTVLLMVVAGAVHGGGFLCKQAKEGLAKEVLVQEAFNDLRRCLNTIDVSAVASRDTLHALVQSNLKINLGDATRYPHFAALMQDLNEMQGISEPCANLAAKLIYVYYVDYFQTEVLGFTLKKWDEIEASRVVIELD